MNALSFDEIIKEIYNRKVGFIGVGQMGSALLFAISKFLKKTTPNLDLNEIFYLCDPFIKEEIRSFGFKNISQDETQIFEKSKIVFICVKPDSIEGLIKRNINLITNDTLLISIAAGISISFLENLFNKDKLTPITSNQVLTVLKPKIIRIMANHLSLILESASVYSSNNNCDIIDESIVVTMLKNVGIIKKVEERLMNVFTALSGSGPAFVYNFAESLIDASLKNGVDVNTAREYAIQVLYGASKYMKEHSNKSPSEIKYIVTTPNGTTIAGLSQLDKHKFKHAVSEAITYATRRGAEIESEKMKLFTNSKF